MTMNVPIFVGEGRLEYEDRPIPRVKRNDDVLLAVEASGICGTDLNILAVPAAHKAKTGIVIGHEGVALVRGVGCERQQPKERRSRGHRAAANLRQLRVLPARARQSVHELPDYRHHARRHLCAICDRARTRALQSQRMLSHADDAALFEPLSCVVGAFAKAPVKPGDNVCVIGAGPMGALFAMLASAHRAPAA